MTFVFEVTVTITDIFLTIAIVCLYGWSGFEFFILSFCPMSSFVLRTEGDSCKVAVARKNIIAVYLNFLVEVTADPTCIEWELLSLLRLSAEAFLWNCHSDNEIIVMRPPPPPLPKKKLEYPWFIL